MSQNTKDEMFEHEGDKFFRKIELYQLEDGMQLGREGLGQKEGDLCQFREKKEGEWVDWYKLGVCLGVL